MNRKLTQYETELWQRTDEVLHYIWDPIGVSGAPMARDEYATYQPRVLKLLLDGQSADQIAAFLVGIEQDNMGVKPVPKQALRVASVLVAWRVALQEKYGRNF